MVERLLREAARLEDDLARRRRQRRASAEFKALSKAEADGRTHASQCRAAAETYERAARRLQLVPATAKNAEGTNYKLDLGVADAESLEAAAAVASGAVPAKTSVSKLPYSYDIVQIMIARRMARLFCDAEGERARRRLDVVHEPRARVERW
mgnify:CR=1 FL=1